MSNEAFEKWWDSDTFAGSPYAPLGREYPIEECSPLYWAHQGYKAAQADQAERVKELEAKVSAYDKWLSDGVYYTTAEAFELHDGYNSKIAQLQLEIYEFMKLLLKSVYALEFNKEFTLAEAIREALGETK